nr:HNH endonuclease signature motif containing protein [uncultured Methanoregula sp.]
MVKKNEEYSPFTISPSVKKIWGLNSPKKPSTTTPPLSGAMSRDLQQCVGNRCEFPRCTHHSQSIHHIKPREEQGKHTYANLISLCDFHHTEAKRNKITRQQLKSYIDKRSVNEEHCVRSILKRLK